MPTYEYACVDCGNRFEILQRIGDDPLTICEICGGQLRKVFHPAGILLKGSGFYKTDSRAGGAKKESGSEPSPTKGGPKKPDAATSSGEKKEKSA